MSATTTLRVVVAVCIDESAMLEAQEFPTDDQGIEAAIGWLGLYVDRDEDGGALYVLGVRGKPGDSLTITQDGDDVAVVYVVNGGAK